MQKNEDQYKIQMFWFIVPVWNANIHVFNSDNSSS